MTPPRPQCDSPHGARFGTEYPFKGANGPALEVIARAMQLLFYPPGRTRPGGGSKRNVDLDHVEFLPDPVRDDPEMLDLTLPLRYDPS